MTSSLLELIFFNDLYPSKPSIVKKSLFPKLLIPLQKSALLFFFLLPFYNSYGNEAVKTPHIINYNKNDYQAGRQNWEVEIDKYGIVFFGNSEGLLYHNHGEWGLIQLPSKEGIRSLCIDEEVIWAGGKEYGYFSRTKEGTFEFTSIGILDYEQIWNIEVVDNTVVFQTEDKIILYHKLEKTTKVLTYYEGVNASVKWNKKVWVLFRDGKIGFISKNQIQVKQTIPAFANQQIRHLFAHKNYIYVPLLNGEIYRYNGESIESIKLSSDLKNKAFFTGLSYNDNSIGIGTVADGFVSIDQYGALIHQAKQDDGLLDNTILSMAKDKMGNIWLGLDYGIAKLELQSAFHTTFKGAATYTITDFQGETFLGTNKGLYSAKYNHQFELQKDVKGQIWSTKIIDSELFISHNSGLTKYTSEGFDTIDIFTGVTDIEAFQGTPFYVVSTYDGLMLYVKDKNKLWYVSQPEVYGFAQLYYDKNNHCIWGEIKNKDLIKITLNTDATISASAEKGIKRIFTSNNKLLFWNGEHFLQNQNGQFEIFDHPLLNAIPHGDISCLAFNEKENYVSYIQEGKLNLLELLSDGNLHSYATLMKPLNTDINKDFEFLDFKNDKLRLATDRGVITYDVKYQSHFKKEAQPIISSLNVTNQNKKYIYPYFNKIELDQGEKDITFYFQIDKLSSDIAQFRYKLLPLDEEWSTWSTDQLILTKQSLKGGDYTIVLQCKVNDGKIRESKLDFSIEKYWHETALLLIPILLIVLVLAFFIRKVAKSIYFKKLTSEKEQIEQQNSKEIIALKEEQLMKYMEIINHKDAFLLKVQSGLDKMKTSEAKKWSQWIDDEINKEKKDLLFHQLFSEIQQDFIKSITEQYPSLTANDIRILSFIRINLSSKEIADLMNITPRSLDTSRYRLRKKLNLEQGVDLHKFIREF
ncbi:LuxR C-terminal-related transcriptional regulator [Flammeovirga sp. SJP92]|uniref:helix-turn-helix and ligand-binding sensor domain-containing protein n=1 Tax=Flammeovirga sp. SJP92 TaxID=1775430 RepID=UPI0007887D0F|nr:hypothetical protein [Flammeovirga sp. SJP92]KXX68172.1 hypothetical protein AVL50_20455 [Flammeovirga sp. SJP92]